MAQLAEFDVFLSHNSQDKPVVEKIAAWLKEQHLKVWYDEWELRPGIPWQSELEQGILNSLSIVVCFGASGLGKWHEPEMRAALHQSRERECPVIPVLLPGCPQNFDLPVFLQDLIRIDFRQDVENQKEKAKLLFGITGQNPHNRDYKSDTGEFGEREVLLAEKERLKTEYRDLQKHLQNMSKYIEGLCKDYYGTPSHAQKALIEQELEQEEERREVLKDKLESLKDRLNFVESQIKRNSTQKDLENLMKLDYKEHLDRFAEFLRRKQSGVFILQGYAGCGLRLLQKRMVHYVFRKIDNKTFPIKLNVRALQKMGYSGSRFPDEFESQSLWRELGKKLRCYRASPEEIAARIRQKCQEQTVLLMLDGLDLTCIQTIIEEFWRQLLTQLSLDGPPPRNPLLLLLVVAEEADWIFAEMAVQERYTSSWRPEIPVRLPPVVHYALQDVESWLEICYGDEVRALEQQPSDMLCKIFGRSQYAPPEHVITGIFTHLCHHEFHEGVFQEWLRI